MSGSPACEMTKCRPFGVNVALSRGVRGRRVLSARFAFGIAERAHHILFESGSRAVVRNSSARHKAPRIVS